MKRVTGPHPLTQPWHFPWRYQLLNPHSLWTLAPHLVLTSWGACGNDATCRLLGTQLCLLMPDSHTVVLFPKPLGRVGHRLGQWTKWMFIITNRMWMLRILKSISVSRVSTYMLQHMTLLSLALWKQQPSFDTVNCLPSCPKPHQSRASSPGTVKSTNFYLPKFLFIKSQHGWTSLHFTRIFTAFDLLSFVFFKSDLPTDTWRTNQTIVRKVIWVASKTPKTVVGWWFGLELPAFMAVGRTFCTPING